MNIAVFASGRGSNFSAIARAVKNGKIKASLVLLVCDNPAAKVIQRAKRAKVKIVLIERKDFTAKEDFENKICQSLEENKIDLIALAGFMLILGPRLIQQYNGRIINIHPALLPAFKGAHAIQDAFDYGVKVTGVTVHFVDEKMDHGPIILQKQVLVSEDDTLASLEAKIHKLEHKLYPEAIKLIAEGKLKQEGRKVKIISLRI